MRKISWVLLAIMLIVLSAFFWGNRAAQDTALSKEIDTLAEKGAMEIDLTTVTDFDWDAVETFGPYTTDEVIEESMGIQFKGDNGGIDILEDRFLLVFADGKNAVKTAVLSRKHGDYTIMDNKILIIKKRG